MKTNDLIGMLANGTYATRPHAVRRRYATALGWSVAATVILMLASIGLRPDISDAAHAPMFWVKLAFPALVLAAALLVASRLSRPGARLGRAPAGLLLPVLAMWMIGGSALFGADPGERERLIFGQTWLECSLSIAMLSAPVLVATLWAMQGLAPTRSMLAGTASGFLAGAAGALVYSFHCPEMAAPFIGIWYLLGMLIPAAVGGVLGAKMLRW